MPVPAFDKGDQVEVEATFATNLGVATNPTNVFFQTSTPLGVVTEYQHGVASEVTRPTTGTYILTVTLDEEGTWYVRSRGVGVITQAEVRQFEVRRSPF